MKMGFNRGVSEGVFLICLSILRQVIDKMKMDFNRGVSEGFFLVVSAF
jgi:hypothetical protein